MRGIAVTTRASEARTQWELALQRWADDGGRTPEPAPVAGPDEAPVSRPRVELPVRLVYRRPSVV